MECSTPCRQGLFPPSVYKTVITHAHHSHNTVAHWQTLANLGSNIFLGYIDDYFQLWILT
jgi:hypothetical protein